MKEIRVAGNVCFGIGAVTGPIRGLPPRCMYHIEMHNDDYAYVWVEDGTNSSKWALCHDELGYFVDHAQQMTVHGRLPIPLGERLVQKLRKWLRLDTGARQ